ncbi:transposase [Gelidibacter mesophilus]|uniref:transposase n=1 Tax=Gelidibacter mesophilus TaxID=169050 RepID=UPI000406F798|nr:transposase [Gelidibacter mesophilus]
MNDEPLIEGNYYHIYNCGNNKENIFLEERNYEYFLILLKKHVLPCSDILSFCLMQNHFHLLVYIKENLESKVISQCYSNLFNAYAKAINKTYNRTGSLFRDRFSRIKITNEGYLRSLIIYINTNPSHHQFVDDFKTYKYSSYKSTMSRQPTLLNRDFVLNLFDNRENFQFAHNTKQLRIKEELLLE